MRPLRLLGLTNLYPPVAGGGYGEVCADVMGGLAERGHDVEMLVAFGGAPGAAEAGRPHVEATLGYALAPWRHPLRGARATASSQRAVRRAIAELRPDAAIVWHMRGVPKPALNPLHDAGIPTLYMLHDRWVLYERAGGPDLLPWARIDRLGASALRNAAARLAPIRLDLRAPPIAQEGIVCFVSEWVHGEYAARGWVPRTARIVPAGVEVEPFREARTRPVASPPRRMLYAGRIHPTKGLDVAVRALAEAGGALELTIAGTVDDPSYETSVRELVERLGLAPRVRWLGEVARTDIVRLLGEHDVLVYPSIGPEGYSLGLIEGFAAGMLIVTSAPGGPQEYLRDDGNALLFDAGDADGLAAALRRLAEDPDCAPRLLDGAAESAEALRLEAVVDGIEALLGPTVAAR